MGHKPERAVQRCEVYRKVSPPPDDPDHDIDNIDNGNYHGGVQDLRFGARYALVRYSPVVVTPFTELVIPSHDYITFAHSAIGRNLNELMVGTNIGWKDEESFLPNAYFQTRISYSFVERVLDRSHNRTNIDTEFSYFVAPRLALSAYTSFTKHHGGLNWDSNKKPLDQWTLEQYLHHDELARSDAFDIGMGTSFQLNGSTSVYGTLIHTTWAINGHPLETGLIVGVTRSFRTRRPVPLPQEPEFLPVSPQVR